MTLANTDLMFQTATYWGSPVPDGFGGGTFPAPIEISCRWEERTQTYIDKDGNESQSAAVVYPDRELDQDGWLFLGSSAEADPHAVSGAFEIRGRRNMPSLDNAMYELKVWL